MGRYGYEESLDSMEESAFDLESYDDSSSFEDELSLEASEVEADDDYIPVASIRIGINSRTHSAREVAAAILAARNH